MLIKSAFISGMLALPSYVSGQLATGYSIGPLTTSDTKWAVKVCDVTNYGAVADLSTDLGPPLLAAFNACADGGIGNALSLMSLCSDKSKLIFLAGTTLWQHGLPWVVVRRGVSILKGTSTELGELWTAILHFNANFSGPPAGIW
jgi:rhamnogalacturonan hydrolase